MDKLKQQKQIETRPNMVPESVLVSILAEGPETQPKWRNKPAPAIQGTNIARGVALFVSACLSMPFLGFPCSQNQKNM